MFVVLVIIAESLGLPYVKSHLYFVCICMFVAVLILFGFPQVTMSMKSIIYEC